MQNLNRSLLLVAASAAIGLAGSFQHAGAADFYQGFESNISGWDAFGGGYNATRVATGTGGISASQGSFYGLSSASGSATNWGGYNSSLATAGFITSADIYLNMGGGWANDTRFDWDSAINDSSGNFLRDFVFNGGFYNNTDTTGSGNRFVFSASNNAGRGNSYPENPGRDPFAITTTGWYTFQHNFHIVGGVLSVDLSILDSSSSLLHSWTLSDPGDVAAIVGGNRYGWFVNNEFSTLAFDNTYRTSHVGETPEPFTMSLGLAGIGLFIRRRMRAKKA